MSLAIENAVKKCFDQNILVDFLNRNTSEVEGMLYEEFDVENCLKTAKEEGRTEGEQIGLQKGEQIGLQKGEQLGIEKGKREMIELMRRNGFSEEQIALISGGIDGSQTSDTV